MPSVNTESVCILDPGVGLHMGAELHLEHHPSQWPHPLMFHTANQIILYLRDDVLDLKLQSYVNNGVICFLVIMIYSH